MEELMNLIATDESPSQISDAIKDVLYAKSADKIGTLRPQVASQMFDPSQEAAVEDEYSQEQ
jgi:hypothetical protein